MKKSRILGYALTLAATLFVGSAMGQTNNTANTNYVKTGTDAAQIGGVDVNKRSYITLEKKLGFFVEPDAAYHTAWITPDWKLTPGFSWIWDVKKGAAVSTDLKFGASVTGASSITTTSNATTLTTNDPGNFVEITAGNTGVYTISVAEKASAAFGGCTGAAKSFDLVVMAVPTIVIDTDEDGPVLTSPTDKGVNNRPSTAEGCGTLTNWNINFTISAADYINSQVKLEEFKVTINPIDGTKTIAVVPRTTFTYDIRNQAITATSTAATLKTAVPTGVGNEAFIGWNTAWNVKAGADFSYTTTNANRADISLKHTRDFKVFVDGVTPANSDVITLYRYTVLGVNDFVTRKSDKVSDGTTLGPLYGASAPLALKVVELYVKRAPVTGPVYHINNNIAK